jgi:hypothetical protein
MSATWPGSRARSLPSSPAIRAESRVTILTRSSRQAFGPERAAPDERYDLNGGSSDLLRRPDRLHQPGA